MKNPNRKTVSCLTELPNLGLRMAKIFGCAGIDTPQQLIGKDPFALYARLNRETGQRYDPCVLDTFIAAVDFMNGGKARAWWNFTAGRKKKYKI